MMPVKKAEKVKGRNLPLKTKDDAVKLAKRVRNVESKIAEKEQEAGIDKLREELVEAKGRLKGWMSKNLKRLDLDDGYYGYVQPKKKIWIGTKDDLAKLENKKGVKPLRSLLTKEQWMLVTKRVVDEEALEQLVDEGDVTEAQIAAAYVEVPIEGYVRFY